MDYFERLAEDGEVFLKVSAEMREVARAIDCAVSGCVGSEWTNGSEASETGVTAASRVMKQILVMESLSVRGVAWIRGGSGRYGRSR